MMQGSHAIRTALGEAMAADPSILLLGDSVGRDGGVAGTSKGLLGQFGASRVRDLPVSDRATLGFAVGLALGGQRPVVELTSTGRLPAVIEVLAEAAHTASGDFPVPMVVRVPYGTEAPGLDRGIGELIATGVQVVCAADAGQAAGLLRQALRARAPVVILEPRAMYGAHGEPVEGPVPFKARILREGDHATLAAWGAGVSYALQAAETLDGRGISTEVIDLVSLSPLDREALGTSVQKTGRLVVAHPDDPSAADLVRQIGLDEAFLYLEAPLSHAPQDPEALVRAVEAAVTY